MKTSNAATFLKYTLNYILNMELKFGQFLTRQFKNSFNETPFEPLPIFFPDGKTNEC